MVKEKEKKTGHPRSQGGSVGPVVGWSWSITKDRHKAFFQDCVCLQSSNIFKKKYDSSSGGPPVHAHTLHID